MTTLTTTAHTDPARRHDFVLVFDAADSNPNGDPDAGNLPRTDPETGHGIVTDVCLKRKVRNYVDLHASLLPGDHPDLARLKVYVEEGTALNERHERAYTALGKKGSKAPDLTARDWMCDNFYDVRMFGAVMTTGDHNCGQVTGPVQIAFARSVDPIFPYDISITRVAVTKTSDLQKHEDGEAGGKNRSMGRKALIPYGLYVAHGTYSPHRGVRRDGRRSDGTGVTPADLDLLWTALAGMWEVDVAAARGAVATRALHVFTHTNPLGDAPRHEVYDRVSVTLNEGVTTPRRFTDYTLTVMPPTEGSPIHHTQVAPTPSDQNGL